MPHWRVFRSFTYCIWAICDLSNHDSFSIIAVPGHQQRIILSVESISKIPFQARTSYVKIPEWGLFSWLEVQISQCQGLWCNLHLLKLAPLVINRPYVNATSHVTWYNRHNFAFACTYWSTQAHPTIQQVLTPSVEQWTDDRPFYFLFSSWGQNHHGEGSP